MSKIYKIFFISIICFLGINFGNLSFSKVGDICTGGDTHQVTIGCGLYHCNASYTICCLQHLTPCGGDHIYTWTCSAAHCTAGYCSIAGCGEPHDGPCGGGHVFEAACPNTWNHCTGGGTCDKKKCSVTGCNVTSGSCNKQHDYSNVCQEVHCGKFVCKGCGDHKGDCGGGHIWLDATCTEPEICTVAGCTQGEPLGHDWKTGCGIIHCTASICKRCGEHNCNGGHKFTSDCQETHCDGKICSVEGCGVHEGICGGGCVTVQCEHCKITEYCTICKNHTPYVDCPCGTADPCSNLHCIEAGIDLRKCNWCELHTCVGCNDDNTCNLPHCGKSMCSVCGKHECTGGHKYTKWEADSTDETQIHSKICEIDNCGVVGETHTSKWGVADTNHTSICTLGCELTYTHDPIWVANSEDSTDSLHADICAKIIGGTRCTATRTHTPTWGPYYKVGYESTTNRGDDNSSGANHTRRCTTCNLEETEHNYTNESWNWIDNSEHRRTCSVCSLRQKENHTFNAFDAKVELADYSHLLKHWSICEKCDKNHEHKSKDDIHVDNNKDGTCDLCSQELWAVIKDGSDITEEIINEERRRATNEEKLKIIEGSYDGTTAVVRNVNSVKDKNGNTIVSDSNGIVKITENGEYKFTLASGAVVTIVIDNISKEILVDIFKTPETATTGTVTILVRTSLLEQQFDKEIYIKEGQGRVTDAELASVTTQPFEIKIPAPTNGTYYFSARDTAGNERIIEVIVNNIVNGQATVAISNDVFVGGYVFTEILVNPSKNWNLYDNISSSIQTSVTRVGDSNEDGIDIGESGIKKISVMDLRRKPVTISNGQNYAPGVYYIKLAIGGSDVFKEKGTHVVDLKSVTFKDGTTVNGINRIIVEVQELNDLT